MFHLDQPFLVDGLVGFFCVLLEEKRFWLVWLINLFNLPQIGLEKCSAENGQLYIYQLKPVAVEMVDPNGT